MIAKYLEKYEITQEQFSELMLDLEVEDRNIVDRLLENLQEYKDKQEYYINKIENNKIGYVEDAFVETEGETELDRIKRKQAHLEGSKDMLEFKTNVFKLEQSKAIAVLESIEDMISVLNETIELLCNKIIVGDIEEFAKCRDKTKAILGMLKEGAMIDG